MDGSEPAIRGRLKTGHFRRPETGVEMTRNMTLGAALLGVALITTRAATEASEASS